MRKSQSKEQDNDIYSSACFNFQTNSYECKWRWRLCDSDAKLFLPLLNLPFLLLDRLHLLPQQTGSLLARLCWLLERACSNRWRWPIPTLRRAPCSTHQVREKIRKGLYRCGPNSYRSSQLVTACRYLFFCAVIGCSTETERTTLVSFLCRWFFHLNGCVDFNKVNQLKETHHHITSLWFAVSWRQVTHEDH